MEASIVDLRYKMKEVLKALKRNEKVRITHRGKIQGILFPSASLPKGKIQNHPFFGMEKDYPQSVEEVLKELRRERYRDL